LGEARDRKSRTMMNADERILNSDQPPGEGDAYE